MSKIRKAKRGQGHFKTKKRMNSKYRRLEKRFYAPCVECEDGGYVMPILGRDLFPDQPNRAMGIFYSCRCGAYVHTDASGYPSGYPCNEKTRQIRNRAHGAFRALLENGVFPDARAAIAWTAERLGVGADVAFIGKMDGPTAEHVTCLMMERLCEARQAFEEEDAVARDKAVKDARKPDEAFAEAPPAFLRTSALGAGR